MTTPTGQNTKHNATLPRPSAKDPRSKTSRFVMKLRNAPVPEYYIPPPVDRPPAPTGPYFCYGTSTDPAMLARLLNLAEEPELRPAYIEGFKLKRWGPFPAIVDAPGSIIEGFVFNVKTVEGGEKLAAYETTSNRAEPCLIKYTDHHGPPEELGYTFKFIGEPSDLTEGTFNLRTWLKRTGRQSLADKLGEKKHID